MAELPSIINDAKAESQDEKLREAVPGLVSKINGDWEAARDKRQAAEQIWVRAYDDFRGFYNPETRLRDSEKSKVFVKIPKTKTVAAYGQLIEIVFAGGKFPIRIEPTEKPEGVPEYANIDLQQARQQPQEQSGGLEGFGFPGDGQDEAFRSTSVHNIFDAIKVKYSQLASMFKPGPSMDKQKVIQIKPADEAAKNMEKTIHDQLTESDAIKKLSAAIFESCLLGYGIIKGPFNYTKTLHDWNVDEEGKRKYVPKYKVIPRIEHVSVFNLYPDPDATSMESAEWMIERHKFSATQMRDLTKRPFFNAMGIHKALEMGPNYTKEWWEQRINDSNIQSVQENRWQVLEYWGIMDRRFLIEAGMEIPEDMDELTEIQVNAWVCHDQILRLVVNPFQPNRIPYHGFPYEENPYNFFGKGVPENMSDSTMIMNGHVRMAIDNLALAGNLIFDIDENALVPGQTMETYPGKIFRRVSGAPGPAVNAVKFQNTANENMMMFDKFRQIADEETGLPSYSHGSTGVMSTTRTASGMSMLMGAAALSIKTVVKNLDDYLLRPLGEAMFHWNMQFNEDIEIRGDLEVKARGTAALMQKEVRSQRLMTFLQMVMNPVLAPFVPLHKVVKEVALSLELDPEEFVNDPEQAALYAQIIGMAGGIPMPGGQPGLAAGPMGNGNATIGTGDVPMPGNSMFSGNTEGNGNLGKTSSGSSQQPI
jgi:hypothetical protein